ncbi:MAG TPA: hypothetical protein VNJ54_01365 [Plantibacter sp.]|uniref:hypothetical protein n=1 Tax=Plantibacter sp. TaxID=1871045 RepID=UPI002C832527|nr:hypothetical protein [Plantibacter sp.]
MKTRTRVLPVLLLLLLVVGVFASSAAAVKPPGSSPGPKSPFDDTTQFQPMPDLPGGFEQSNGEQMRGAHDNGRGGNTFVNDPCLDPAPTQPEPERRRRTVQSETEIAVLNTSGSMGKKMVAGWNDSFGFYDREEGLSGYGYSTDGGNTWIDGGGLPPAVPGRTGTNPDRYFGDPVLVVHHASQTFYYASIYLTPQGVFTLSVNRGKFQDAPPQDVESISNTRCANDFSEFGVPDPPQVKRERIIWEPPVQVVTSASLNNGDFLDKEWMYVDQKTGSIYVTYTRFAADGSTPIEVSKCMACANSPTFTTGMFGPPTVIVPNEATEFNQATQPYTTNTGRVIVTWFARSFDGVGFAESEQRIEYAYSDDDAATFTPEQLITQVNPQGEPLGYNRGRATILNAPYITVDKGEDDGTTSRAESSRAGFNNVYVTYFSGKTPLGGVTKAADIFVSTSTNNGTTFGSPVKVNDDATNTIHVFPSVQANKHGDVYVGWIDRRNDPTNVLNETWAAVSKSRGATFGHNVTESDVATSWFARADARPNFGDYNSSELLGFNQFVQIWADGRFPNLGQAGPSTNPLLRQTTPDTIFGISQGLGVGGG